MPYSQKAHNLFEARAHGADFPMAKKIPIAAARKMASEGIKDKPKKLGHALKGHR